MNRSPIIRSLVQTLLGAWLGLGTQPRYKAPGKLQVEIKKKIMTKDFIRLKLGKSCRFYKVEIRKIITIPTPKKHYSDKKEILFC